MKIIPSPSAEEAHRAYLEASVHNSLNSNSLSNSSASEPVKTRSAGFGYFFGALACVTLLCGAVALFSPFELFPWRESGVVSALAKFATSSPTIESSQEELALALDSDDEVARRLRFLDSTARARLSEGGGVVEGALDEGDLEESGPAVSKGGTSGGITVTTPGAVDNPSHNRASISEATADSARTDEDSSGWLGRFQSSVSVGLQEIQRNVFQITRTEISGHSRLQEGYIRKLAGLPSGSELLGGRESSYSRLSAWDLPLDEVNRTLRQSPWIEDVQVSVSYYPATLRLKIREAEPWLVVYMGGKTWLVSTLGQPLEALETLRDDEVILQASELPRLEGVDGGSQQAVNARFQYAVNILRLVEVAGGLPFAVDRYRLLEEGGVLATPPPGIDAPEVVLGASTLNQAEETLQKLKVVLDDLKSRGEVRSRIDMRFLGQAIVR